MKNWILSTKISDEVGVTSPIIFAVGKILASRISLALETRSPFTNLSTFCLVQSNGLKSTSLIPGPV